MASTYSAVVGCWRSAALFASLGTWQFRRADASRATLAQFASGAAATRSRRCRASSTTPCGSAASKPHGEYVAEPQFLLDNMLHDGAAGYHVLTPLRVHGPARARARESRLGAGRRRSPRAARRRRRRRARARHGPARAAAAPRPAARRAMTPAAARRRRRSCFNTRPPRSSRARLGEPVFDYQLLLDAEAPDGYVREWRAPGVAPERHLSYAGQWLGVRRSARSPRRS